MDLLRAPLPAVAAPLPPAASVEESYAERLVGTWDYGWGGWTWGEWAFFADGTCASADACGQAYAGHWHVRDGTLRLWDRPLYADGSTGPVTEYTFTLVPAGWGFAGETPDGVRVVLSERRR